MNSSEERVTAYTETASGLMFQLRAAVVDYQAFEQKVKPCELSVCKATCCYDGVYLSKEEVKGVKTLLSDHKERFDDFGLSLPDDPIVSLNNGGGYKTMTRIAEGEELASDFPSHFKQTRCVFLDREGRCGIQRLSMELGRDPWYDKPITCWLHPISILPANRERSRPVVTLFTSDNDPQNKPDYPGFASCTHCGRSDNGGIVASAAFEKEFEMLSLISGRDFLAELNAPEL